VAPDKRHAALAAQLTALLTVEEELLGHKAALQGALDRALLDKTRAERGREAAQLRADALQKQCEALLEAAYRRGQAETATHMFEAGGHPGVSPKRRRARSTSRQRFRRH